MKNNKLILAVLIFGLMTLTFSSTGFAFPGNGWRGMMNFHMGSGYSNNVQEDYNPLDLNEEQQELLKERREEFIDKYMELDKEMHELNLELIDLIMSNSKDEDIDTMKGKITTLQNNLLDIRTEYWKGLQVVLTNEQLEELNNIFKNRESKSTYYEGSGMGIHGFWGGRMKAGRNFYPGMRYQFSPNSFGCPFGF